MWDTLRNKYLIQTFSYLTLCVYNIRYYIIIFFFAFSFHRLHNTDLAKFENNKKNHQNKLYSICTQCEMLKNNVASQTVYQLVLGTKKKKKTEQK